MTTTVTTKRSDLSIGHLVSPELIARLRATYPLRAPALDTPDRKIWLDAGIQSVIDYLQREHEEAIGRAMNVTPR